MSASIGDYALIGDCETAALVSRDGSIDWLCWPAFDSEACFAALLGGPRHGAWSLGPAMPPRRVLRRYVADTLVLETRFDTASGELIVTDFMPPRGEVSRLIRIVRCARGRVTVRSQLALRFEYGHRPPWITWRDGVLVAFAGPAATRLDAEPTQPREGGEIVHEFELAEGQSRSFVLSYFASHEPPPPAADPERALAATLAWWRDWSSACRYHGRWREAVIRSLITLKALTYRPTGGLVAAPTSSIPESPGGRRNWDYRYCWLRDATFTLLSLLQAGYEEEAAAWRDWLLRAVAGQPADLQPLYTLSGRRHIIEWEADWLPGFGGARPVRFGNAAAGQWQLDAYGEVVDALFQAELMGVTLDEAGHRLQRALVEHVQRTWRKPDHGLWEVRGRAQRFTHSQAMAWVALDRGVRAAERLGRAVPVSRWIELRDAMHAEVCRSAFDPDQAAFTQALGSDVLDASVLLLPHVGFLPARDPRMISTVAAIQRTLMEDGFVRRYSTSKTDDGISGSEGVFLACSFWLADTLVLQHRRSEAEALFERLLAARNDVGLLSEEYSPARRQLLGNFPQALSHLSLVNSAFALEGRGAAQTRSHRD